jgi:hypothetical protein
LVAVAAAVLGRVGLAGLVALVAAVKAAMLVQIMLQQALLTQAVAVVVLQVTPPLELDELAVQE